MLYFITDPKDPKLDFVKDDPVRPEIPKEFRVGKDRFVASIGDETPTAMVCVNLLNFVPSTVQELGEAVEEVNTAVFYTIWSYAPGAGKDLLLQTVEQIKQQFPTITRFVTLSPKTEMARRFHTKNGAGVFRDNAESVNYEYPVSKK
jgi:hypothetical protein